MSGWTARDGQLGAMDGLAMDSSRWTAGRNGRLVGILPDGYVRTNPLPQIPTKQSIPPSKDSLIPIAIPTLRSLIGPAIDKVQIPWLSFH